MQPICLEDWERWRAQGCTRLPAMLVRPGEKLPDTWTRFWGAPVTALLESGQVGRYTYLCDRPSRVILGQEDRAEIWSGDLSTSLGSRSGKPLEVLAALQREAKTPAPLPGWPAMAGGFIALLGYDLVKTWENLPMRAARDLPLPLYAALETGELFIYDHAEQTLVIVVWTDDEPERSLSELFSKAQDKALLAYARWYANAGASPPHFAVPGLNRDESTASYTPAAFHDAVGRIHEYIAAGHTYQVNLSLRWSRPAPAPPEAMYEALRRINPSPYMGLVRFPDFALVCGSPELLVKYSDRTISSRPIAGTRPRGDGLADDQRFSTELLANEKERAEHLMLVDLIRNDIGHVAAYGSVHVRDFMVIERYSHVMHIVSQVEGRLADGETWVDLLRSMFPGGTITGCPKFRTMEIIEELEPVGRGFYTGSLGWISYHGELEMNIIIRSILVQAGTAHVQTGAGIVADSQPEHELDEVKRKAQALWAALDMAAQPPK